MSVQRSNPINGFGVPRPLRVLILDDDRFDRKRLLRVLKSEQTVATEHFETASLENFEQALATGAFDVVFVDYQLVDGSGFDALTQLFKRHKNCNAFVVMISGLINHAIGRRAMESGCDLFLSKETLDRNAARDILLTANARRIGKFGNNTLGVSSKTAVEFWSMRARRRTIAEATQETETPSFDLLKPQPPSVDKIDVDALSENAPNLWFGSSAFFIDFQRTDEFEFECYVQD